VQKPEAEGPAKKRKRDEAGLVAIGAIPTPTAVAISGKPAKAGAALAAAPAVVEGDPQSATASEKPAAGKSAAEKSAPEKPAAPERMAAPQIVEPRPPPKPMPVSALAAPKPVEPKGDGFKLAKGVTAFVAPPITILTGEVAEHLPLDRDGLTATAEKLRQKLASFGIQGQVTQIRPGPVVTMFEFLPAAGVKVSRIASLSDDLAMAMEAMRVRIVAPIPGKGVVGIEVPNKQRETVVLRELVEQEAFQKSQSRLAMCLGKDIEGMPYVADLAKMPHLLIAGTTGSGKSVAVNSMIVSMLLRATPEEVRFLMVDPKMLELSVYEGIPHLLLPVVTDAKKAAMALRWAVEEMERRYQLLADCGVRNIASYNKKVEKDGNAARLPAKAPKEKRVVDLSDPSLDAHELTAAAASGELERKEPDNPAVALLRENERKIAREERALLATGGAGTAQHVIGEPLTPPPEPEPEALRKLPYLVIIIDELADLMMVASREVETYIARLAQMARAAGIHLMVATQRPSTDVVTGVIKANFPARISFQVASRHDSATIINTPGAENLLGMGDMLILPPGTSALTRVHGPYVDEKEIHAVVEHWKAQGAPVYDPNILKPRAEDGEGLPQDDEGPDELYDQAIASLADMRFISISLLQRKLRVGYNRAARMIERMERDGIVGPADGAKPREVLIRPLGQMGEAG
jgi:S-DNA-T family DNA segregation ATPase FtsK/SpoIIIE